MYYTALRFNDPPQSSLHHVLCYRLYSRYRFRTTVATDVELAFSERSLRQLCERKAVADRKLGAKLGERIRRRVAELHAAAFVTDLVTGQPHLSESDHYTVRVVDNWVISYSSNHRIVPRLASGKVDWRKVSRIKILKIGLADEHN